MNKLDINDLKTKFRSQDLNFFDVPKFEESANSMFLAKMIADNMNKIIEEDIKQQYPLFLRVNENFIYKIAKRIIDNPKKTIVIGVAGESASGKTTLARNVLNISLKDRKYDAYTILPSDDYYHDSSEKLKQAGSYEELFKSGFTFDEPSAVNLELLKEHIRLLSNGREVYSPSYDFVSARSIPNSTKKSPSKVVLTEGLFVLDKRIVDIMDIAIYVYTPFNIIKERWYKRTASRGKTGVAADMNFEKVNYGATNFIRPTMHHADIVVSGMVTEEYTELMVDKIISAIKKAVL